MTEATVARLEQIIELSKRHDTHANSQIRELAERALADERPTHEWEFYMNGSFCKRCGAAIGSGSPCR